MKCVVCEGKTKVIETKDTNTFIRYRHHECMGCLTRFKTSEKVIFESIPAHIRNHFLDTGKRGGHYR